MPLDPETVILSLRVTLHQKHDGRWDANTHVIEPQQDPWPADPAKFGEAVRRARQKKEVTQSEVADEAGVSAAHLRNIEMGRTTPSPSCRSWIVTALARLGLSPGDPLSKETETKTDEPDQTTTSIPPNP